MWFYRFPPWSFRPFPDMSFQAPSPKVLTRGAGAAEAVDSVLADPTVDTRATLTLVNIHLAIGSCEAWGREQGLGKWGLPYGVKGVQGRRYFPSYSPTNPPSLRPPSHTPSPTLIFSLDCHPAVVPTGPRLMGIRRGLAFKLLLLSPVLRLSPFPSPQSPAPSPRAPLAFAQAHCKTVCRLHLDLTAAPTLPL